LKVGDALGLVLEPEPAELEPAVVLLEPDPEPDPVLDAESLVEPEPEPEVESGLELEPPVELEPVVEASDEEPVVEPAVREALDDWVVVARVVAAVEASVALVESVEVGVVELSLEDWFRSEAPDFLMLW